MKYHSYVFLTTNLNFQNISQKELDQYKKEFFKELTLAKQIKVNTYAILGLKTDSKILFWIQSDSLEDIQDHLNNWLHTKLGRFLKVTQTLFGMVRPTLYSPKSTGHLETDRKGGKYLIIYPFTKTQQWYQLDFEERRNLMGGHVVFGKKHPKINQLLLYSYGVDDSEFIVSYETDDLFDFQSLVMELRMDKVRGFTQKDTPIFTCIYKSPQKVLGYL